MRLDKCKKCHRYVRRFLKPNLLRPKICRTDHETPKGVSCVKTMRLWSVSGISTVALQELPRALRLLDFQHRQSDVE